MEPRAGRHVGKAREQQPDHLLDPPLCADAASISACQLISGGNVSGLDAPILQAIPDEVILDANVLASLMKDRILG